MKGIFAITVFFVSILSHGQKWHDSLDDAMKAASREQKQVLLYFSVADACDVCKNLERNIFSHEDFKRFAEANFILVKPQFLDSEPIETKARKLMIVEKYNKDGFFPHVVIVDPSGRMIGKTEIYNNETPEIYIRKLKMLQGK